MVNFEFKVVRNKNFHEVSDDLPIINSLNALIKTRESHCFNNFINGVPLLFVLRDEIHTSIIDKFIKNNKYIHPGCKDAECTKEALYEIIYNAPIFLFSKHTTDKNHPTFGYYYLEANKPLLPDPST